MAQPKIQQYQTDVIIAGGEITSYVSAYRASIVSIPEDTDTEISFTNQWYEVGGDWWTPGGQTFSVPAGISTFRAQLYAKFQLSGGAVAIPRTTTMVLSLTNPSNPSDYIATFSINGSGTTSPYAEALYAITPWRPAAVGTMKVVVYHNHTGPLDLEEAWINMEGM